MNITSSFSFSANRSTSLDPSWDGVKNTLQTVVAAGSCIIRVGQAFFRQITFLLIRSYLFTTGALSSDRFTFNARGACRRFDVFLLKMLPTQFLLNLTHLNHLDLSGCALKVLPDTISKLKNLRHLNLSGNELRSLPDSIGSLANLEGLFVSNNQLQALPDTIGELGALIWLDAEYNRISHLPNTIGRIHTLLSLGLVRNPLENLPAELNDCPALRTLSLDPNSIGLIPLDPPRGIAGRLFPNVRDLDSANRKEILIEAARVIPWNRINHSIDQALPVFRELAAVNVAERRNVINYVRRLVNPDMEIFLVVQIIREIVRVPEGRRENYVGDLLINRGVPVQIHAERIHVHGRGRDARTKDAIERLRQHQRAIHISSIEAQAVADFRSYLRASTHKKKALAERALAGPIGTDYGPLLSPGAIRINGLELTGSEIIARLWTYASTLETPDDVCAKDAMISALAESFNDTGNRVCNPGKTQRLIVAVLSGRLAGVDVDEVQTLPDLTNAFFALPENTLINDRATFIEAMRVFRSTYPSFQQWETLERDVERVLIELHNNDQPWPELS
ncbi:MAG: leucine-rich repeat domain-containing protein [Chlamydiae bacterium]|nr:leucine-rich repeat domain-containing protein [Chlamydiota bacterium]